VTVHAGGLFFSGVLLLLGKHEALTVFAACHVGNRF